MRQLRTRHIAARITLLACLALGGCGHSAHRPGPKATPAPDQPKGPAFGITETDADLLWNPGAKAPAAAAPFLAARRELSALHPRYMRLLVNWAAIQPSPQRPPALRAEVNGCARDVGPCGAYAGIAEQLAAIASQQRADRAEGRAGVEVVIDILGAPGWAALQPHGCEPAGTPASARPLAPAALDSYRALISEVVALGRREGVALPWWSPWNEPNDPRFLSPQRNTCSPDGAPAATAVYAQLTRAMSAELNAVAPGGRMLLGELGGYERGSPHRLSIAEFVGALPQDVICLSDTWSVHAYAAWGRRAAKADPVAALEAALDARGGCASTARIWVTESGAGAPDPGRARIGGPIEERAGCRALAAQVLGWQADPRVGAVFQYEFRDDPAFPVGLLSADLSHLRSTYGLWLGLARAATQSSQPATPDALCPD